MENYFNELSKVNVNANTDKKGRFTYLSWAWAWAEVKKIYPNASYEVERFGEDKLPYIENELGYMIFTKVTINDITHEMWLPVMDFKNQAIPIGKATMMEINKTIMRCLVKNIGMHGLGLYIYAGEDLPEEDDGKRKVTKMIQPDQLNFITDLLAAIGDKDLEKKMLKGYKVKTVEELDFTQASGAVKRLQEIAEGDKK